MGKLFSETEKQIFRREFLLAWNESIGYWLSAYRTKSLIEVIKNEDPSQRTQQLSSMLSPLNEQIIKHICSKVNPSWKMVGGLGYDSVFGSIPIEHKFGANMSNSMTGHPYSNKTSWHLLMKCDFGDRKINKIWIGTVSLDSCSEFSQWPTKVYESSSYSSLKLHNSDINNVDCIFGGLTPSRKWLKFLFESI